jgi:hypothetical protein
MPQVGVLAQADHVALAEALLAVLPEGLADDSLAPLADALGDLAALDAAGEAAIDGKAPEDELLALAESSAPWPEALRSRRFAEMPDSPPAVRLSSGGAAFTALYAAQLARSGAEAAQAATRRLLSLYLARAEPLARIVLGARALQAGSVSPDAFAALLKDNLALLASPPDPERLVEALRGAHTVMPRPFGPDHSDRLKPWLDWVRKSPWSAFLLPENQAAVHCVSGLGRLWQGITLPEKTPGLAVITPRILCHSPALAGGITLVMRGSFGPQVLASGVWGVSVSSRPATITRWTDTEIEIATDALRRGCNPVQWSFATEQETTGNGVDAACSEWLRRPLLADTRVDEIELLRQTGRWVDAGSVSVLGPLIDVFDTPPPPREGFIPCADVLLRWRLDALPCASDRAAVTVRLLRDGVELARGLPFAGSRVIADPRTAEYTLEVSATVPGGPVCNPPAVALVTVPRAPAAFTLTLPSEVVVGTPVEGSVAIPCDAPPGGQLVELVVASGALGVPAQVTIPAGQRSVRFAVTAGDRCGEVTFEARAPGYLPAAGSICVVRPLSIAPNQSLTVTGCELGTVTLRVNCVGRLSRIEAALVEPNGQRTPLRVLPDAMPPQRCLADTLLTLSVPPSEPGAYRIEIGNGIGARALIPLTIDPPRPEIVVAPAEISETIGVDRCPPPEQRVRVSARGHTLIRAVYENPEGRDERVVRRTGRALCPTETAEFGFVFDRVGTLIVTAEADGVVGPERRIPVRLIFGSGVFSSVSFIAEDPPPIAQDVPRPVRITRKLDGSDVDEGLMQEGERRTFALGRCVRTFFLGERQENAFSSSGLPGPRPLGPFAGHPDAAPFGPEKI